MTFVTHSFEPLGRSDAAALGMGQLPIVVVPHPVGGMEPDIVRAKADRAFETLVAALTGEAPAVPA